MKRRHALEAMLANVETELLKDDVAPDREARLLTRRAWLRGILNGLVSPPSASEGTTKRDCELEPKRTAI
jgi:hypothetical protein